MGRQIKDTNVVKTPPVVIDPAFFMPDDVLGMESKDNNGAPYEISPNEDNGSGSVAVVPVIAGLDLLSPSNLHIVSQTVVFAPDGSPRVDVVFEFNDVDGAANYEIRWESE